MIRKWPITKDTGNTVNQSKLEGNRCSGRKGRENLCVRVTVGFGFNSDWMKTWQSTAYGRFDTKSFRFK